MSKELNSKVLSRQKMKKFISLEKITPKTFFFVSSTIVFLSYIKPIFSAWAYSDEFDFFEVTPKLGTHMAQDGNLISSLIYDNFSVHLVSSAGELWRLRVISFLCLFLILNHVSSQILTHNQSRSTQFLLPIALILPAPMTFISWSLIWQGSFAMLIAYGANVLWLKSRFGLRLISIFLLWSSILMSPVAAFSIFGFHAVAFILSRIKTTDFVKVTIQLVFLYGISGIASIVTLAISNVIFGSTLNGRVGPPQLSDLPEKLYWIISRPIVVSMRFFDISSPTHLNAMITSLLVLSLLVRGFVIQSKNLSENVFSRLILFFALISISITPIVITWSNQIEFRYILGPSIAFFLVTVGLILEEIGEIENFLKYAYLPFILLILFSGIISMNNHINSQFISPYNSKIDFIQSELSICQSKNRFIEKVIVLQAITTYPSRNNIGIFSQSTDMASPWVPIPSVKYVLKTVGIFPREIILQEFLPKSDLKSCIVDLEKYSQQLAVLESFSP
jgi:hypothetical protein